MAENPQSIKLSNPLRSLWEFWKHLARKIANLQARVLLIIFYFVFFCPFALAVRWGSDPLGIKRRAPHGWLPRSPGQGTRMEAAKRQF
jgi:hypothetical protein